MSLNRQLDSGFKVMGQFERRLIVSFHDFKHDVSVTFCLRKMNEGYNGGTQTWNADFFLLRLELLPDSLPQRLNGSFRNISVALLLCSALDVSRVDTSHMQSSLYSWWTGTVLIFSDSHPGCLQLSSSASRHITLCSDANILLRNCLLARCFLDPVPCLI